MAGFNTQLVHGKEIKDNNTGGQSISQSTIRLLISILKLVKMLGGTMHVQAIPHVNF